MEYRSFLCYNLSAKSGGDVLSEVICHNDFPRLIGEGSPEERAAKVCLAAWGIDYDSLAPEEFVVLIGILEKSNFKENSISRRGKKGPTTPKRRKK